MTPEERAELRARAEAATPGPRHSGSDHDELWLCSDDGNKSWHPSDLNDGTREQAIADLDYFAAAAPPPS